MGELNKAFFVAHDPRSQNPKPGTNKLPIPNAERELLLEVFRPGDGPRFHDFLTGPVDTAEPERRRLPKAVVDAVAHQVNLHRKAHAGTPTGYLFQLVGKGEPELHWTLEHSASKAGRFDPSDMRIAGWQRAIHYAACLTCFDRLDDMERWLRQWGFARLYAQRLHVFRLLQEPRPAEPWFQTEGWQRLPEELVARFHADAKELIFPTDWQMFKHAVHRTLPVHFTMQPFSFLWELNKEASQRGPKNCVPTVFAADVRVELYEGAA